MNQVDVFRRLEAWRAGRPLPLGETLQTPLATDDDVLLLAFVRMGGESAPWGIGWRHPGGPTHVLTAPEPRNRDLGADLAVRFAPALLGFLRHPAHGGQPVSGPPRWPARQIWVPNPTHLEMLHYLDFTFTRSRFASQTPARLATLNALGRAAGWLFRESTRPGQVFCVAATEALRKAYTFPAEDARQGHLGFLMAWLATPGSREERMTAARDAEGESIATSLDPRVERDELQPLLERYNAARAGSKKAEMDRHARAIEVILTRELERRLALGESAREALRRDKRHPNQGLVSLVEAGWDEYWFQYLRIEQRRGDDQGPAWVAAPETDRHPSAAASRYLVHCASEEARAAALLHFDAELQRDAIERGDAISGRIVTVEDRGVGRSTAPFWVVEDGGKTPLRLRVNNEVCVASTLARHGKIRSITATSTGLRQYLIEVTHLKTTPRSGAPVLPATDQRLVGQHVVLLSNSDGSLSRQKSLHVWDRDVPGAWLTHSIPPRREGLDGLEGPIGQVEERDEGDT